MIIKTEPTPNPNALKFIVTEGIVKNGGKSTYRAPKEAESNFLAKKIFDLRGVDTLHFFANTITVTKFRYKEWDKFEDEIVQCINDNYEKHDPNYEDQTPEKPKRKLEGVEQEIDKIVEEHIRPGLRADGGDLEIMGMEENVLSIRYQGACGNCPASTTGTLRAIEMILRKEFSPDIQVAIV